QQPNPFRPHIFLEKDAKKLNPNTIIPLITLPITSPLTLKLIPHRPHQQQPIDPLTHFINQQNSVSSTPHFFYQANFSFNQPFYTKFHTNLPPLPFNNSLIY
ncbi:hypothetical protein, partial [Bacillus altitudinis]|uniref:hypothetical protein n=1 Tax=Bacillus altitudinis TaxID=293387 RepID=UPI001C92F72B